MADKTDAPQVVFDIVCSECKCDVLIPLMKLRAIKSFSGNKIQVEWPNNDGTEEFASVACPKCGAVMVVKANGQVTLSESRLSGRNAGVRKAKAGARK